MKNNLTAREIKEMLADNGYENIDSETIREIREISRRDKLVEAKIHRAARKQNREISESKKERNRRFQKLCRVGGTVEKYFPEILEFYPNELDEFFYSLFFFSDEVRQYIFDFIARSNFKQNQSAKGGGASG